MMTSEDSLTPSLRHATRATPLLSASEEQRLARAARAGDRQALDTLLRAHFRLVFAIAREHARRGGALDDLIGEGMVGLMEAGKRFDPERGVRFATCAALWIRAYVRRFWLLNRGAVRMPQTRNSRTVLAHLATVRARFQQATGRRATSAEVAEALGVSERDVDEMETALRCRDVPHGVEIHGRTLDLASSDPSPEAEVMQALEQRAAAVRIRRALAQLSERERFIVQRHSLSDDTNTLVDIGRELGISNERVRQIEAKARKKLRGQLLADEVAIKEVA